jgi:hypothetical protein
MAKIRPHLKNIQLRVPASFVVLEGARRRLVVTDYSSDEQRAQGGKTRGTQRDMADFRVSGVASPRNTDQHSCVVTPRLHKNQPISRAEYF